VLGVGIGFAGAFVLSSPALDGQTSTSGVVILVVSGVAWATGLVVMRWWDFTGVSPLVLTATQLGMSTAVVVPIALVVEGTADTDLGIDLALPLFYASVPATAVTFVLMTTVTRRASATQAASVAYLTPLSGVLFAWIIRSNRLSLVEWIGGALLVVGVVLVTTVPRPGPAPRRHRGTPSGPRLDGDDEGNGGDSQIPGSGDPR
jgi:drug/metabolite transporter (DMT)-like permease